MLTYSCFGDLSGSDDPYILSAIDNDLEYHKTVLVNLTRRYFDELLKIYGNVSLEEVYNNFGSETIVVDRGDGWKNDCKNRDDFIDLGCIIIEKEDGSKRYIMDPNADWWI